MLGLKEELQIRQWAREEFDKKAQAKQTTCEHLISGTIKDGILTCDFCDKVLTPEDEWYPESRSPMDQRYTDSVEKQN